MKKIKLIFVKILLNNVFEQRIKNKEQATPPPFGVLPFNKGEIWGSTNKNVSR